MKSSISPRKFRRIQEFKPLFIKSKSIQSDFTSQSHAKQSPKSGILKKKKESRNENFASNFELTLSLVNPAENPDDAGSKKVSFNRQITVKESSKIIEMIDEDIDEMASSQKENTGVALKKTNSSFRQNAQKVPLSKSLSNTFQTPNEDGVKAKKSCKSAVKPPLFKAKSSDVQTTEKKEMDPKGWKANRIRNQNKKAIYNDCMRKPYRPIGTRAKQSVKAKIRELNSTAVLPSIDSNNLNDLNASPNEENVDDYEEPSKLKILPSTRPSFISGMKNNSNYENEEVIEAKVKTP
mmetsp:Transcript_1320/g.1433  ORF Transcript_1320/g.1433 Transcript_1320/m.1433 type:complete len:294 (+) Transcript_1320:93-974(+)